MDLSKGTPNMKSFTRSKHVIRPKKCSSTPSTLSRSSETPLRAIAFLLPRISWFPGRVRLLLCKKKYESLEFNSRYASFSPVTCKRGANGAERDFHPPASLLDSFPLHLCTISHRKLFQDIVSNIVSSWKDPISPCKEK